jgi:hypothetical protein
MYSFLCYLSQTRQGENLKATAVRKYWAIPVGEFMQATSLTHNLHAWPHKEVIRIPQYDLSPQLL